MTFEELYPGGPRFPLGGGAQKLGTDSLALAHFAGTARVSAAADLGCGAATLMLLLAARRPGIRLDGVEIDPDAARLGREALEENGLTGSCRILTADLRDLSGHLTPGRYDLVISNPPYFPVSAGRAAAGGRALARDERRCGLGELCAAASALCRHGGAFAVVHRPERLAQVFSAMSGAGLEPKRLRLVAHRTGLAPSLALIEGRRGGKPGLKIEPELVLYESDGRESSEHRSFYSSRQ